MLHAKRSGTMKEILSWIYLTLFWVLLLRLFFFSLWRCYHSITLLQLTWSEVKVKSVMSNYLRPHGLYSPWNYLGQKTGVGSCSLLQGIFQTQGSNPGLPHYRHILYHLSHQRSPRILEWVAYSFSRRSSQPRNQTRVSGIAGRFFTSWATRETQRGL